MRTAIVTWIERTYHRRRRQRSLSRLTPIEYETIMTAPASQAAGLELSPTGAADPPYANGAAATVAISAAEVAINAFSQYMGTNAETVLVAYRRRRERLDQLMNAYALGDESMVDRLRASGCS